MLSLRFQRLFPPSTSSNLSLTFSVGLLLLGVGLTMGLLFYPVPGYAQYAHSSTLTAPDVHEGAEFGATVAGMGDVDGDGTSDILVGAPTDSVGEGNSGRVFLFSGADGRHLQSFRSPNAESVGLFGDALAGVGDVNGDGVPDLAVTAEGEAVQDANSAGRVYVFSGADGSTLHALASPNAESYGHFGSAVASIGDVNADGTPDVLVGARGETVGESDRAGRLYVVSGADGHVLSTVVSGMVDGLGKIISVVDSAPDDEEFDLFVGANLATVQGTERAGRAYRLRGPEMNIQQAFASPHPEESGFFGEYVTALGDMTGDGVPDVGVSAELETVNEAEKAGRAYLLDGAEGRVLRTFTSPKPEADARFGFSMVSIEEGAGTAPVVMVGERPSIYERAVTENTGPGQVYVFNGADGQLLQTLSSPNAEERGGFGATLTRLGPPGAGDRVAVGATGESVNGAEEAGRVYLYTSERD